MNGHLRDVTGEATKTLREGTPMATRAEDRTGFGLGHHATTVAKKSEYWPQWIALLARQFEHGGDKYAFTDEAEWTDVIRQFDPLWVHGTMLKYIGRYKAFGRERDLIKIATYCFILWLQDGHHLKDEADDDTGRDKLDVEEVKDE